MHHNDRGVHYVSIRYSERLLEAGIEPSNWLGHIAPRGINESYGVMVNYLYDPEQIETNHEAFVRDKAVCSKVVDALLATPVPPAAKAPSGTAAEMKRSQQG